METIDLQCVADKKFTSKELVSFINRNLSGFVLKTHYSYIGSCQSSIDVMQDHLEMAFILEKLLQYAEITRYERHYNTFPPLILATLIPNQNNITQLTKELCNISILKAEDIEPDREDLEDIIIDINEFEENVEQITFKFWNEIEDYYANYVNQGIYELASEFAENDDDDEYLPCFKNNPEWQYGFWKNHLPRVPKESVYFSSFCWIIKDDVNVDFILSKYSGINEFVFDNATIIDKLLINDFAAIDVNSFDSFNKAITCIDKLQGHHSDNYTFQISRNIDIVKINYSGYFIIYFDFKSLREDAIRALYNKTAILKEKLSNLLGISNDISPNWALLTDESFEELCYDIICNDIRFDNTTIRKMGKSKSRDGGRDIVVWTKPQIGESPKKYIIQCKLTQLPSLTKSKMNNASNVIIEYNADGYMIMTNAVIDSALYDMLDGFARHEKMQVKTKEQYDKFRLEKYLYGHPELEQKYFSNVRYLH
jgi:hypothetical protein